MDPSRVCFEATDAHEGQRLAKVVSDAIDGAGHKVGRNRARRAIAGSRVIVNGEPLGDSARRVHAGWQIDIDLSEPSVHEKMVVWQDESLAVVWKESGLSPLRPGGAATAAAGSVRVLRELLPDAWCPFVNWMGKGSAGLVLVAKSPQHYWRAVRTVNRLCLTYRVLVEGRLGADAGAIDVAELLRASEPVVDLAGDERDGMTFEWHVVDAVDTKLECGSISALDLDVHLPPLVHEGFGEEEWARHASALSSRLAVTHVLRDCLVRLGHPLILSGHEVAGSKSGHMLALTRISGPHPLDDSLPPLEVAHEAPEKLAIVLERRARGYADLDAVRKNASVRIGGVDIAFNEHVMRPREAANVHIGAVVRYAETAWPTASTIRVLDLGTGSGCLLLAAVHALTKLGHSVHGVGLELSTEALAVARANACANGLDAQVDWIQGDFGRIDDALAKLPPGSPAAGTQFHIILANPPYIAADDGRRRREIAGHKDPDLALFTSGSSMLAYEAIASGVGACRVRGEHILHPTGLMLIELPGVGSRPPASAARRDRFIPNRDISEHVVSVFSAQTGLVPSAVGVERDAYGLSRSLSLIHP